MHGRLKWLVACGLLVVSSFVSYQIAYRVGEAYFFDKLFYYKSVAHGYWVPNKQLTFSDFGDRAKDVLPLIDPSVYPQHDTRRWQSSSKENLVKPYTVAIIGDSYVWGQGVRFEQAVSKVLEKKLNAVRSARVLSLGIGGDDMIENYAKYRATKDQGIDLYVYVLVNNDVLLNLQRKYGGTEDEMLYRKLNDECRQKTATESTGVQWSDWNTKGEEYYIQLMHASYTNPSNLCILDTLAKELPKDHAIYFVPDPHDVYGDLYIAKLKDQGLYIVDVLEGKTMGQYARYFGEYKKYFQVSSREDHPSVLAHQMYADILFRHIMTEPQWGFIGGDAL